MAEKGGVVGGFIMLRGYRNGRPANDVDDRQQGIGAVAVRNCFMTTAGGMFVRLVVASTGVIGCAGIRILIVHLD